MTFIVQCLLVLCMALHMGDGPGPWTGHYTAHYSKGLMERVAQKRHLPLSDCYMASPDIPIGTPVEVVGLNTGLGAICIVADTSQPWDKSRHQRTCQRDRRGRPIIFRLKSGEEIRCSGLIEINWGITKRLCGSTTLRNDECPTITRVLHADTTAQRVVPRPTYTAMAQGNDQAAPSPTPRRSGRDRGTLRSRSLVARVEPRFLLDPRHQSRPCDRLGGKGSFHDHAPLCQRTL